MILYIPWFFKVTELDILLGSVTNRPVTGHDWETPKLGTLKKLDHDNT